MQSPQTPQGSDDEISEGNALDSSTFCSIIEEYQTQIIIPEKTGAPQFFLCPVGLVGAGKTTVIMPLAEHFHLVRISTDEIRKLLMERGYNLIRTKEIAFGLIRQYAEKGFSIAVDADCVSQGDLINKAVATLGAKAIWIHINPPEEFIINKLRNFKHTWLFKNADEAVANYFRRKPLHEHLDFPFIYIFDTSKPTIVDQIAEAIQIIDREMKR